MRSNQSRAEQFYQELAGHSNPVAFLHGLVTQGKAEDEFLEFKGASRIAEKDAKQYWSQALSGFANTEGGVLIWGIRAARIKSPTDPSRNVDSASELDLAAHPETFLQMLKDVRLEVTVDPVQGVEYKHYDAGKGDGSGFVVCLIPEGVNKPYRAALDPAKQYYQRVGDSFAVIPHSLLRSLFYPRLTARLGVEVVVKETRIEDRAGKATATFGLSMNNSGTATARDLYFPALADRPDGSVYVLSNFWTTIRNADNTIAGHRCATRLHPGQTLEVGTLTVPQHPSKVFSGPYRWDAIRFRFTVYATDHVPQEISIDFSNDDLSAKRTKQFWGDSQSNTVTK